MSDEEIRVYFVNEIAHFCSDNNSLIKYNILGISQTWRSMKCIQFRWDVISIKIGIGSGTNNASSRFTFPINQMLVSHMAVYLVV